MKDSTNDEKVFADLEGKLLALVGSKINVEICQIDDHIGSLSEGALHYPEGGKIELLLEDILRDDSHYGLGILGKSRTHYWVIGMHTPHGYISRIEDNVGVVIYENRGPYYVRGRAWGINCIIIQDYRKEMGWHEEAEDPPNPFFKVFFSNRGVSLPAELVFEQNSEAPAIQSNMSINKIRKLGYDIFTAPGRILDYFFDLLRAH